MVASLYQGLGQGHFGKVGGLVKGDAGVPVENDAGGKRYLLTSIAPSTTGAILREINYKGDKARFRKVGRGKFELAR